jgi:hypothetical protein
LPEIAKICNGKRFVDTDGKNVGENKREAKPLKRSREKKVGKRKARSHENENSIPVLICATTTNGTQMIRKRRGKGMAHWYFAVVHLTLRGYSFIGQEDSCSEDSRQESDNGQRRVRFCRGFLFGRGSARFFLL